MVDGPTPGAPEYDLAEGTLDASGQFQSTDNWISLYVPTLPVRATIITVMDADGVTAEADFDVTETTELVVTPASGPPNYNITLEANYFTAATGTDITVEIYNSTWDNNLLAEAPDEGAHSGHSISANLPQTNGSGSFSGWFLVPDIDLGDYWLNATDENALEILMIPFSVVEVTVEVTTVRSEYAQGEDITFKIKSTFPSDGSIDLMDSAGFNTTLSWDDTVYQQIGDWYFAYPATSTATDAPLGTWDWTADVGGTIRKGSFSVVESTTGVVLIQRINELEEDLAQLSDSVDALSTSVGGVSTDLGTVEGYVDDVEADLAAVSAAVSGIEAAATAAEAAATDAKAAAEAANTTASGISMAVYGSMALSLIAALAAIAAVLTLQRKVAG
jgi:hypothetical protein